jgi:hypothetical protein
MEGSPFFDWKGLKGLSAWPFQPFSPPAGLLQRHGGAADEELTAGYANIGGGQCGPGVVSFRWACTPVEYCNSPFSRRYQQFSFFEIVTEKGHGSLSHPFQKAKLLPQG